MLDLILILSGVLLAAITKNRRWLILTLLGAALFVAEVLYIAFGIALAGT